MNLLYNHPVAAAVTVCLIAYGAAVVAFEWHTVTRWLR